MTTPNQGRPDGAYSIAAPGGYQYGQQGLNESTILGLAAGGARVKFEYAQNVHNSEVKGRFVDIEEELSTSGAVVGDHENRIIRLESGSIVAEYFSNDIWHVPVNEDSERYMHHHTFIAISGGGGGGRPDPDVFGPRPGASPGGQGGYASLELPDNQVEDTVTVVVGTGGVGGYVSGGGPEGNSVNGQPGTSTHFSDSGGSILTPGAGAGGVWGQATTSPGAGTHPEWNAIGGYGGGAEPDVNPVAGGGGYLAAGGPRGVGDFGNGGNGGDCPAGRIGPGGGGGGGDHYGNGGHGGFPGGGGGGGGNNRFPADALWAGNGGNGGHGRSIIISSPGL